LKDSKSTAESSGFDALPAVVEFQTGVPVTFFLAISVPFR
jgi:hypothetical protein